MHNRLIRLITTTLVFALAGCAGAPPPSYDLHAVRGAHLVRGVTVDLPNAATPLDSDLVVVREPGDLLTSLSGAQWADRLTLLVQSRVIESLGPAGLEAGTAAPARLTLEITRFDIDAATRTARVNISARLTGDGGRLVAARIFSDAEPVAEIAGAEPPQALDRAFGRLLPQIVAWASTSR
jgi:ABC-type uncharacterized transport system auxiliary subunit